jgi:hypothetical protein
MCFFTSGVDYAVRSLRCCLGQDLRPQEVDLLCLLGQSSCLLASILGKLVRDLGEQCFVS